MKSRPDLASQIDEGLNFFLWLIGRQYDPDSFRREYSQSGPRGKAHAPIPEMYNYIAKERKEQRILQLIEYRPTFLSWTRGYLQQDPADILRNGESVARAAFLKITMKRNMGPPETARGKEAGWADAG